MTTCQRVARRNIPITDRPLSCPPNQSYRLKGAFGWIMIGASDAEDAYRQALRSSPSARREDLQVWDGARYVPERAE